MFTAGVADHPECNSDKAFVYTRVACLIPDDYWKDRMLYGLAGAALSVFVYLYTLVYFDYIRTVQKNLYVDYDIKTITAGDYTIEFDVDRKTYAHWQQHYYDKTNILPEAAQFRQFIWKELETICSAIPNQGFEVDETDVKIAQITMAYDNAKVIDLLQRRGDIIKTEKWDKVAAKNA